MWKNWQVYFDVVATILLVIMTAVMVARTSTSNDLQTAGEAFAGG